MSVYTHENGTTLFYQAGELVYVVIDRPLPDAKELFKHRFGIGIVNDDFDFSIINEGDCCDISLIDECALAGLPYQQYLEFLAQDAIAQELEALELFV